jgi:hypothetical protein
MPRSHRTYRAARRRRMTGWAAVYVGLGGPPCPYLSVSSSRRCCCSRAARPRARGLGRMQPPMASSLPPTAHSLAGPRPARQISTAYSRATAAACRRATRPRTPAHVRRARRCKARAASSRARPSPRRAKSGRPAAGRCRRTWSSVRARGEPTKPLRKPTPPRAHGASCARGCSRGSSSSTRRA